jgi:hypothetical protein
MEIKISEELLSSALEGAFNRAIESVIQGYDMRAAIIESVSSSIAANAIGQAVADAVKSIDKDSITQAIAHEMQRCIVSGIAFVVEDTVVEIIAKIRGVYMDDGKKRIREELKKAKGEQK